MTPPPAVDASAVEAPLAGVRVIDVTQVWAGPFGCRFLADMGADTIKIEGPTFPDSVRGLGASADPDAINRSAYFNEYNRNKRGLAINLQQPAGAEAVKRLIADADVFVENWSSGVADRLGLGYEALRAINPRLIYVSMPGFGHDGPDREPRRLRPHHRADGRPRGVAGLRGRARRTRAASPTATPSPAPPPPARSASPSTAANTATRAATSSSRSATASSA